MPQSLQSTLVSVLLNGGTSLVFEYAVAMHVKGVSTGPIILSHEHTWGIADITVLPSSHKVQFPVRSEHSKQFAPQTLQFSSPSL